MALVGVRLDAVREFQSEMDDAKGTDDAIIFKLGTLSSRVMVVLRDQATKFVPDPNDMTSVTAQFLPNQSAFETVRFGLKGWAGFKDDGGNEILFKTVKRTIGGVQLDAVDDACLDAMPIDLIRELSEAIVADNEMTEEQEKNSAE